MFYSLFVKFWNLIFFLRMGFFIIKIWIIIFAWIVLYHMKISFKHSKQIYASLFFQDYERKGVYFDIYPLFEVLEGNKYYKWITSSVKRNFDFSNCQVCLVKAQ